MHLGIYEMDYRLFNGYPERLNADFLPPSFKLDHVDGGFLLETLLFIRGDAINLSFQQDSDVLRNSQARGRGFYLSIGWVDMNFRSLLGGQIFHPISLVFGCSFQ